MAADLLSSLSLSLSLSFSLINLGKDLTQTTVILCYAVRAASIIASE